MQAHPKGRHGWIPRRGWWHRPRTIEPDKLRVRIRPAECRGRHLLVLVEDHRWYSRQLHGTAARGTQNHKQDEGTGSVGRPRNPVVPWRAGYKFHGLRVQVGELLLDSWVRYLLDYSAVGHVLFRRRRIFSVSLLRVCCPFPPLCKRPKTNEFSRRPNAPAKLANPRMERRRPDDASGEELRDEGTLPLQQAPGNADKCEQKLNIYKL